MKKFTLILLSIFLLLIAPRLSAQVDIRIGNNTTGNGATTYPCPLQDRYEGSKAQYLYLASELHAAGMQAGYISGVKFFVISMGTAGLIEGYSIKMGATSIATLDATSWLPTSFIGRTGADYTPIAGWNNFAFPSGFFWNGTDNVVLEMCNGESVLSPGVTYTNNPVVGWTTGLPFNATHTYRIDNIADLCATTTTTNTGTMTTRPDVTFSWTPATACTGAPTAGTATASVSSTCAATGFSLTLSGGTVATGIKYQWQSSTDGTTWNNMPNDTLSTITTTQMVTSSYRCVVTCEGSALSDNSTPVQVTSPALVTGDYTINQNAPAGGRNFQSFNDAYNYIKCGISGPVRFEVVAGSGTYNEQLMFTPVPGASATNTITFYGHGSDTLTFAGTTSSRAIIKLDNADYFTFKDLVLKTTGTYGWGFHLQNDADNNTINGCTLVIDTAATSTNFAGIVITTSNTSATTTGDNSVDTLNIINNTIIGGYYSITSMGGATIPNLDINIKNNKLRDFYQYGIYFNGNSRLTVEDNIISRPVRRVTTTFYGIYATGMNTRCLITSNRITNPFGANPTSTSSAYGIYFTNLDAYAGLENTISNNLMYKYSGVGNAYGIYLSDAHNNWYYHNTISIDGAATATTTYNHYGIYVGTKSDGNQFFNNLVSVTRSGGGNKYGIYFNTTTSLVTGNNNIYYNGASDGNNYVGYWGAAKALLADWQAAAAMDTNSYVTNPIFRDTLNGDFTPNNASVNNLGTPISLVTVDILDVPRSTTTPDIGAYEFTPPPCAVPPTPGISVVDKTPVCFDNKVSLSLQGNTIGDTQTYQWQTATDAAGPFTNLGAALTNPDTIIAMTATTWFRAAVTCSGNTAYSTPVLVTVNPALAAGRYSIDKSQPASATNFISFNAAKEAMACGIAGSVVFDVVAGTGPYVEQLILDSIPGVSATSTITFNGNGNTISFTGQTSDDRATIKLRGLDHVTFDSLIVDARGTTYGYGFQLYNNADSITISRCTVLTDVASTSSNYSGIVVSGAETSPTATTNAKSDGLKILNNTVTGGYYGIIVYGDATTYSNNNTITGNIVNDWYSNGILVNNNKNVLIDKNDLSRPVRTNSTTAEAISVENSTGAVVVSSNRVHDLFAASTSTSTSYAIRIYYTDGTAAVPVKVINNLIYRNTGGSGYGLYSSNSPFVQWLHNTVVYDDNAASTSTLYGFYHTGAVTDVYVENNIFKISRAGTGTRYGMYFSTAGVVKSDYNHLYVKGAGNAYTGYSGGAYTTLDAWRTGIKLDSNSIDIEPIFADPGNGNYEPAISPMDNRGKPAGVTTDIRDAARSTTTPDMGAYEFTLPDCTTPIVPGTAVVTPNTPLCMGNMLTLNLTGNSRGGKQTYQWFRSYSAAGPWDSAGTSQYVPLINTELTTKKYFRCMIVCGGTDTAYSSVVMANMNDPLLKGVYSIDPSQPASTTNFQSFTAAAQKLECGIAGSVTFEAVPGVYTEQVVIRRVPGATDTSRVTFTSKAYNAASVTLSAAGTAAQNYVVLLDSSSYITWKNITIKPLTDSFSRGVVFAKGAAYDSVANMIIDLPVANNTTTAKAGIFGDGVYGAHNSLVSNTITNGSSGIYWLNTTSNQGPWLRVEKNTVKNSHDYGIYTAYTYHTVVAENTVEFTGNTMGTNGYGIYNYYTDSTLVLARNNVNVTGIATRVYGIYLFVPDIFVGRGDVTANKITMRGNTGDITGLLADEGDQCTISNNVINIQTTGASSYGLYSDGCDNTNIYNNTILNSSRSTANNYAAYFVGYASDGNLKVKNNIFAHDSSGRAVYYNNSDYVIADYNNLYTNGTVLIRNNTPAADYATLPAFLTARMQEQSGIVYKPALISNTDLRPDVNNPEVWAIHGRGVQAPDNTTDINGNPRPAALTAGVPDMGAYEFVPQVIPPVLPATPAAAAPGTTQTWMFGTDTVAKITWKTGVNTPTDLTIRRYSGVKPPNAKDSAYMYFYTDVDANPNATNYDFLINQFYVDSWQGFIKSQKMIRLAMTDTAKAWWTDSLSVVNANANVITDSIVHYMDYFTGMEIDNGPSRQLMEPSDSSNRGTKFWVAYGHHQFFGTTNTQDMVLYFNAHQAANVTVRINGTSYERLYQVPANTAITSEIIPKIGAFDARLMDEGLSDRGISIESDVPIEAYAHIYGSASSGATMLLPVGTYGYDYATLQTRQYYSSNCYSWFYVVAHYDNTTVEVTPAAPTRAGRPANVPFTVTLMKGEVYQVLGAIKSGSEGYDLTGSHVRSIQNSAGNCYPVAVFSGSSRTSLACTGNSGGGDNMIQQNFPSQAWGRKYLTSPMAANTAATNLLTNIYRVVVKDTATKVTVNGSRLNGLINKLYYEYQSGTADVIEADQPIMVAQYMPSSGECTSGSTLDGDPEMVYISPVEQGINNIGFYRNTEEAIRVNYLNVIIPTPGLSSLRIDGSNVFDHTYPHPNAAGYTVVMKRWGATAGPSTVTSDSAFTAIIYGEGSVESYGYNAGTLVKNLNILNSYTNVNNPAATSNDYTCAKTPFRFSMLIQVKPNEIVWKLSEVPNLTPHADIVTKNPVPVDSISVNGRTYYRYVLDSNYVFSTPGMYYVPIRITHPAFESCNNTFESVLTVKVIPAPVVEITTQYTNCINDLATFNGSATTSNGVGIAKWKWEFSDTIMAVRQDTARYFKTPGTKQVKLSIIADEGCIGDTTVNVEVFEPKPFVLVQDSVMTCEGNNVTFQVKDPQPNAQYTWYDAPTGGTLLHSGTDYTIAGVTTDTVVYVESSSQGCSGGARVRGVVKVTPPLTKPVVTVDSIGVHFMHFKWNAVPYATGYMVSADGGNTWVNPSSGPEGLTHALTGLEPVTDYSLIVKALGCEEQLSDPAGGKTLPDGIFIPNTFTPNNDGKNDVLLVYGYIINTMHLTIFNQWGEKVFETMNQQQGWDGSYKGKALPSGVYIYVSRFTLTDGTVTERKGVINLIR
ncbi:gliding motility-associated C-terminal domain-containing protein [Chitinophaga sp. sic0106]|uniref:T9SS type B sorting domain-containing protein n=1 Tax=Chitinophaga sp. sic0106 TaxID=2854785 RepID=UPI001C446D9A|nr:gliding motility-associated C-terminal domain-containing protein [Chitinophaga sp. sic0106]MBV7530281.1 gliding motility-associated C-terminal domain-containing protein [Chitinophaga sp. sic0106]